VEIVRLVPDDWVTFRDLRIAALTDAPHAFSSKLDRERALRELDWRTKLESRAQFAAMDDGVVGTAGAYREGEAIELISMWVAPRARNRGIGAALVETVVAHARSLGVREVRLRVREGNATAERLYVRCGFARNGVVEPMDGDGSQLEAEMVRVL
jgi:ribosomal protein S18 acetylase RimI-like enzyme